MHKIYKDSGGEIVREFSQGKDVPWMKMPIARPGNRPAFRKKAIFSGRYGKKIKPATEDGVCAALSIHWLCDCAKGIEDEYWNSLNKPSGISRNINAQMRRNGFEGNAENLGSKVEFPGDVDPISIDRQLAEMGGLQFVSEFPVGQGACLANPDLGESILQTDKGCEVLYKFIGVGSLSSGHGIGVVCEYRDKRFTLFDPNEGVVRFGKYEEFVDWVDYDLLYDYFHRWCRYTSCFVLNFKRAAN